MDATGEKLMAKIYGVKYQIPQPTLGINEEVEALFGSAYSRNFFVDFLEKKGITERLVFENTLFDDTAEAVFDYERRLKHD